MEYVVGFIAIGTSIIIYGHTRLLFLKLLHEMQEDSKGFIDRAFAIGKYPGNVERQAIRMSAKE
jgi:hypothetical protein